MNLTLSVDEQVVERARAVARSQGTSLNDLVRKYLESLAGDRSGEEIVRRLEQLWSEGSGHSGGWRFNREEIYAERLDRYKAKK